MNYMLFEKIAQVNLLFNFVEFRWILETICKFVTICFHISSKKFIGTQFYVFICNFLRHCIVPKSINVLSADRKITLLAV